MTLLRKSVGHFGRQLVVLRVGRAAAAAPTISSCHRSHRVKARQVTGHSVRLRAGSNCGDIPFNFCGTAHPRKRAWCCIGHNGLEYSKNLQKGTIRSEAPKSPSRRYGERSQTKWAGGQPVCRLA